MTELGGGAVHVLNDWYMWARNLGAYLNYTVTSGKFLNLSQPLFPPLRNHTLLSFLGWDEAHRKGSEGPAPDLSCVKGSHL